MKSTLSILALVLGTLSQPALAQDATIIVTGTGEVSAVPDMARINLGVRADAATAAEAVRTMSADMDSVLARLKEAGIASEDIQTSSLRVDILQSYNEATRTSDITGYTAATDVSIRVLDLDSLGRTLDAAVQDGANQISGLSFDLQDRKPALDDARRAAVTDAADKAALYAQAAGVTLGPIKSLTEGSTGGGPQPMMRMAMESADSVPIAAGQIMVNADVTITYGLGD